MRLYPMLSIGLVALCSLLIGQTFAGGPWKTTTDPITPHKSPYDPDKQWADYKADMIHSKVTLFQEIYDRVLWAEKIAANDRFKKHFEQVRYQPKRPSSFWGIFKKRNDGGPYPQENMNRAGPLAFPLDNGDAEEYAALRSEWQSLKDSKSQEKRAEFNKKDEKMRLFEELMDYENASMFRRNKGMAARFGAISEKGSPLGSSSETVPVYLKDIEMKLNEMKPDCVDKNGVFNESLAERTSELAKYAGIVPAILFTQRNHQRLIIDALDKMYAARDLKNKGVVHRAMARVWRPRPSDETKLKLRKQAYHKYVASQLQKFDNEYQPLSVHSSLVREVGLGYGMLPYNTMKYYLGDFAASRDIAVQTAYVRNSTWAERAELVQGPWIINSKSLRPDQMQKIPHVGRTDADMEKSWMARLQVQFNLAERAILKIEAEEIKKEEEAQAKMKKTK